METKLVTRLRVEIEKLDSDGKPETQVITCDEGKEFEKLVAENAAENQARVAKGLDPLAAPQEVSRQTFKHYTVQTDEDFVQLVPELTERNGLRNRALGIKQANFIREFMTQEDEEYVKSVVDGVYDLAPVCAQPPERKVVSKETRKARALRDLAGLSEEELRAMFEDLIKKATVTVTA